MSRYLRQPIKRNNPSFVIEINHNALAGYSITAFTAYIKKTRPSRIQSKVFKPRINENYKHTTILYL